MPRYIDERDLKNNAEYWSKSADYPKTYVRYNGAVCDKQLSLFDI